MKQLLVNLVIFFWPVMPNKVRSWAFWNDEDIKDATKIQNDLRP